MQWNFVSSSNLPAPGMMVLGLWLDGFWKQIMYFPGTGWYTSLDGVEHGAPAYWAGVSTAIVEQLPPQAAGEPKAAEELEVELDRVVLEAEQEAAAARQRRDAFRQRLIQKQQDAAYLCDLAAWLSRTDAKGVAADLDVVRLREIAERLKAIVLQE